MDPIANPYSPGAGTPPPYLAGRVDLDEAFDVLLGRAELGRPVQPIVLSGLRGVGKTVLLLRWLSRAAQRGWAAAHLEVRVGADLREQLVDATIDILRDISRRYRNAERVQRLRRVATSFARAAGAKVARAGLTFEVDPESGVADSGSLESDLTELLVVLGEAAAEEGSGAVIFIDELQDAGADELGAVVGACHRINQEQLPALIVGAGLPTVGKVLSDARSYAERLYDIRAVGPLDDEAQRLAVTEPARELGVEYDDEALDRLATLAGGYPFFVQTHAKHAWDRAVESPISGLDVEVGATQAEIALRTSFFSPRVERATPAERRYMRAMAALGDDAVSTSEVAAALGKEPSATSVQRDGLLAKGLVYAPERGQIAFTVPHMSEFLRSLPGDA